MTLTKLLPIFIVAILLLLLFYFIMNFMLKINRTYLIVLFISIMLNFTLKKPILLIISICGLPSNFYFITFGLLTILTVYIVNQIKEPVDRVNFTLKTCIKIFITSVILIYLIQHNMGFFLSCFWVFCFEFEKSLDLISNKHIIRLDSDDEDYPKDSKGKVKISPKVKADADIATLSQDNLSPEDEKKVALLFKSMEEMFSQGNTLRNIREDIVKLNHSFIGNYNLGEYEPSQPRPSVVKDNEGRSRKRSNLLSSRFRRGEIIPRSRMAQNISPQDISTQNIPTQNITPAPPIFDYSLSMKELENSFVSEYEKMIQLFHGTCDARVSIVNTIVKSNVLSFSAKNECLNIGDEINTKLKKDHLEKLINLSKTMGPEMKITNSYAKELVSLNNSYLNKKLNLVNKMWELIIKDIKTKHPDTFKSINKTVFMPHADEFNKTQKEVKNLKAEVNKLLSSNPFENKSKGK